MADIPLLSGVDVLTPSAPEHPVRLDQRAPIGGTSSNTLNQATTYTVDASGAPVRYWTLTANPSLAVPTNGADGQTMRFWLLGSGAGRTFTFASGYEVSPAVPSRTVTVPLNTWVLVEAECRAGTWRLVSTDQTLNAPAAHASTHQAGGSDPLLGSASSVQASSTTNATNTTATYAAVANTGVVFVAPPSGRVLIEASCAIVSSAANTGALAAPVVLTGATIGSGTSVLAAADGNAVSNYTASTIDASRSTLLTGLTPGASYNAQLHMRNGGSGTATTARQRIVVTPLVA